MKSFFFILFLPFLSPIVLLGQTAQLEIKPTKLSIDSLENNHLRAVYFVTNKSKDTLNISLTISFDWCMPQHQPKVLLPGQTDSVVFDCGIKTRPLATSQFSIIEGENRYVCTIHYTMKREAFYECCVPKQQRNDTFQTVNQDTIVELKTVRQTVESKRSIFSKREKWRRAVIYYSNDSIASVIEVEYFNKRKRKKTGQTNLCKKTYYYSNGIMKQYIEEYNCGYSYCETCPRKEVVLVNKKWDKGGNLIFKKKQ